MLKARPTLASGLDAVRTQLDRGEAILERTKILIETIRKDAEALSRDVVTALPDDSSPILLPFSTARRGKSVRPGFRSE